MIVIPGGESGGTARPATSDKDAARELIAQNSLSPCRIRHSPIRRGASSGMIEVNIIFAVLFRVALTDHPWIPASV